MDIEFNWTDNPNSAGKEAVENEISEILKDRDIKPCHLGGIYVTLGIRGPLDNRLEGSAKCSCGKTLMTFEGGSSASNLTITEFK